MAEHAEQRAIINMTPDGLVTSWNPVAALLYGYPAEQIVGRAADVLYPPERQEAEAEFLRRVITDGPAERTGAARVCQDGTVVMASLTAAPIVNPAGAITGVTTVSWKVSPRQGGRGQDEAAMDSERTSAHDLHDAKTDAERRDARDAQELFDVTADAKRRDARDAQELFDVTADAKRGGARDAQELFDVTADAERRDARDARELFDVTADAERRDARDARELFDITADAKRGDARDAQELFERSEALERKQLMHVQLQQAQRLENLGQLAGGIAHDFNNLLAVILNYVAFATEELDLPRGADWPKRLESARSDLGQVTRAVERAAGLTRQLLLFARREVIQPQVLDLDSVITAVEDMLRRTIGDHIELVITLGGNLRPVLADPGKLEQVLVNLAVNARDAMPGGGTLTIDTSNIAMDDDDDFSTGGPKAPPEWNVRLRVSDTGIGMTADVAEHIFEPFFTTKDEGAGTGLGLATVYGIIAQAQGRIQTHSEPGIGTIFSIMLPVTAEAPVPVAQLMPSQWTPNGETVLVVEHEEALREVTRRIFTRHGCHVITAANGPQALDIARGHPAEIHLLVADVALPRMLGREVAERIRAIKPGIEVLFMTGHAEPALASQGKLDPGMVLVAKPFSEAELLAKAGQLLNGHVR